MKVLLYFGYRSTGVHHYFFNELRICILVQNFRVGEGGQSAKLGAINLDTLRRNT